VPQKRSKIWIDKFQTALSVRLAMYFVLYQVAVWCLYLIDARISALGESLGWPAVGTVLVPVVAIGLGVLFIYDAVKEAHRTVGPLYRFRKTIQSITAGEEVPLIKLRQGDHLQELKEELNAMLQALEQRGAVTLKVPGREAVTT
jgi:hypothetical protein